VLHEYIPVHKINIALHCIELYESRKSIKQKKTACVKHTQSQRKGSKSQQWENTWDRRCL